MTELRDGGQTPFLDIDFQGLGPGAFRALALERLVHQVDEAHGDHAFHPEYRDRIVRPDARRAAVLIPVIARQPELTVLLTKRTDQLSSHKGQIAFPGGRIDDTDPSPEAAALREAQEETGLDPALAEVLGRLPDYYTGSGYRIAPIVGLIDPAAELAANPGEVDYLFEVPLGFLMDPANHRRGSRMFEGNERFFLEMPYGEHYIWGITAGIIRLLHDRLRTMA